MWIRSRFLIFTSIHCYKSSIIDSLDKVKHIHRYLQNRSGNRFNVMIRKSASNGPQMILDNWIHKHIYFSE